MKRIVIIVIILLIVLASIIIFGKIQALNNKIKKKYKRLNICFEKRWEIMPNIIGIANSYVKYEKESFKILIEILNMDYTKLTEIEKIKINTELTKRTEDFITYIKSYPEIEENPNYIKLKSLLDEYENEIVNTTKTYNELSTTFNEKIEKNPAKIIAKIFRFKKKPLFK